MKRYILKHKHNVEKLREYLSFYGIKVVDDTQFPNLLLIECPRDLPEISEALKNEWDIFEEKPYKLPDTREII